jgi:hypothetical protein
MSFGVLLHSWLGSRVASFKFAKLYFNMTGRKLSDVERWQAAGMVIGGM